MNQRIEPEFSRDVGGHRPYEFKAPLVWLEHVRPVFFQESDDPTFQLGPLHAINWTSSLDFLPHVLNLICDISGKDQGDFTVSPAFRYEDGRRVAKPGAGIFLNEGGTFPEVKLHELETALTFFCQRVLQGQEIAGQGQFFPVVITERCAETVAKLADNFLASFGGKKVGEARLLRTKNCEILVAGTYRPGKDMPLPDPARWTTTGEIDGLRGMTRTVFISTGDRKTISVLFNEASFKEPLRSRVLDGAMYEFVIETEWIDHDKTVDTLASFHPCGGGEPIS